MSWRDSSSTPNPGGHDRLPLALVPLALAAREPARGGRISETSWFTRCRRHIRAAWLPLTLGLTLSLLAGCTFDRSGLGQCRSDPDCPTGQICSAGSCVVRTDLDAGPDTRDGGVDAEDDTGDGALDLAEDGTGDGTLDLADQGCEANTAVCDAEVLVTCDEDGVETRVDCAEEATCPDDPFGCRCEAGRCVANACLPDTIHCIDDDVVSCDTTGGGFETLDTCDVTELCVEGACIPAICEVGSPSECVGDVIVGCSDTGAVVVESDCAVDAQRCEPTSTECVCGEGAAAQPCEGDEACSDAATGQCLCGDPGVVCDEGETCEGEDGCRCGTGVLDCQNGAACVDGACECPAGTYGTDCGGLCDCQNGATCDDGPTGSGDCTCQAGFYGSDCAGVCGDCSGNGSCRDGALGDGGCDCLSNFYGTDCANACDCGDRVCDDGELGNGSCDECFQGTWGDDCQDCPGGADTPCNDHGTCDDGSTGTGVCTCDDGYWDTDCGEICPGGADTPCSDNGTCDPATGVCSCEPGYWDNDCGEICPGGADTPCSDNGTCNPATGVCSCEPGYWDTDCGKICPGGADTPCNDNGTCDPVGGTCSCEPGYWDTDCGKICPGGADTPCSDNGTCDPVDGTCDCEPGYWDTDCSKQCPGGASNPCSGPTHGICSDGATGDGLCTCEPGFFNPDCSGECPSCDPPQICDDGANGDGTCTEPRFRIQRGVCTMPNGDGSLVLSSTIENASCDPQVFSAPVDSGSGSPNPAFFRLVNTRLSGMGRSGGGKKQPDRWMVWVDAFDVTDPTSVTFARFNSGDECIFTWELIEYTGAPDGPNAMAVRALDRLPVGGGGGDTTVDTAAVTVDPPDTLEDSQIVVFITGQGVKAGSGDANRGLFTAEWLTDTDVARFTRNEAGKEATVSYAVVEFTGSNWSVERRPHHFEAADTEETETITSVGPDTSYAFVHSQVRASHGNVDELGAEIWLSSPTTVSHFLEAGADPSAENPIDSVVWVVSNSDAGDTRMLVDHYVHERSSGLDAVWTEPITSVPDAGFASILGESGTASGSNDEVPRGSISLRLLDTGDAVELRQSDTGTVVRYRYSVVRWPSN